MKTLLVILSMLLMACSQLPDKKVLTEKQKLHQVIERYQQFYQGSSPFHNSKNVENHRLLPDLSAETLANNFQATSKIFDELNQIDQSKLVQSEQINYSVLHYKLKNQLDSYLNKEHYMPLTAESGFHVGISWGIKNLPFTSVQNYQDYLVRLSHLPRYFAQQMAWMEKGIASGRTQPAVVLQGFEQSIQAFVKEDVRQSVYYQPFNNMPSHIPAEIKTQLQAKAIQAINDYVLPSYQQYYQFMVERYQPNARNTIAAASLPNGQAYYQNRVAHYTTLALSADEIHQIGIDEVSRIRAEMESIIEQVGFQGDFTDFVEFLRTDSQFYAKTPEQLLKEASFIAKKMDAKLPSLFKTLPRTPYGVAPVPANIAPKYTTGRYAGPSNDDQPGYYWVNTYRLDRRPLYVLEALTLHEAVPGHHLQGSLAREMQNVPAFRNNTYISAFGEGWGLYAEYLGIEADFYQDPYSDFGRLTYEMWRACRLVVDTGMHSKGWSRERAMAYLADNTALSLHNVKTEIDRYISWPGQALSYKLGELTIKRLRKQAEQALGAKFDLRSFHDEILKNGSMPLSMLEQVINRYIEQHR
ncbi:DUF885 domain-containing protein [Thalassotalea sp. G2M2-11]|uniref:DUF885 domain-containing protein n=1 Tax=Thalassotalea sp. G2M2-11 TaxID=2787627 RepID=UPI0019D281F8|nr:DUF885 domain-containing protein [Thalassotalea sp. G2M2-11]